MRVAGVCGPACYTFVCEILLLHSSAVIAFLLPFTRVRKQFR